MGCVAPYFFAARRCVPCEAMPAAPELHITVPTKQHCIGGKYMLKRTVPALLCLLALSSPLTAFAADGDAQAGTGTAYPDNGGTVSVIT